MERNDLDLSGFPRLEAITEDGERSEIDISRDAAWAHLSWGQHEFARKQIRRHKIERVCKWICVVMGAVIIGLTVLVAIRP